MSERCRPNTYTHFKLMDCKSSLSINLVSVFPFYLTRVLKLQFGIMRVGGWKQTADNFWGREKRDQFSTSAGSPVGIGNSHSASLYVYKWIHLIWWACFEQDLRVTTTDFPSELHKKLYKIAHNKDTAIHDINQISNKPYLCSTISQQSCKNAQEYYYITFLWEIEG